MHLEISLLSPKEMLAGFRVHTYQYLEGPQDRMTLHSNIAFSLGLIFLNLTLTIKKGA
jgi:hypothetical protein